MKTIKSKIIMSIMAILAISMTILGVVTCVMNYQSTTKTLESAMLATARIASERIEWEMDAYKKIAIEVGTIPEIANPEVSVEAKRAIVDQRANTHGFVRGNVIGIDGRSIFDGTDFSDRDYVKASLNGDVYVSEPLVSKISGELTVIVSAPIWAGGVSNTTVVGAVYFVPPESFLNDIVTSIKVSENAAGYILDKNGNTIADISMEVVKNGENIEEMAKTDPTLEVLAVMHKDMRMGGSGFGSYTIGGINKFLSYAPIENTNGWSIGINAYTKDFTQSMMNSIYITIALLIISLVLSFFIANSVGNKIGKPITLCAQRISQLATGDLTTEVPVIKSKDETGILAQETATIVKGLKEIIGDTKYILSSIADGDLTIKSKVAYPGEFEEMQSAIVSVIGDLNSTMSQINVAAEQVNSGAEQVSSGAQELSQGATEQASSIEELSATIAEISSQINTNANNSKIASGLSQQAGQGVVESNKHMQDMIESMQDISGKSNEIGKIIKTIDDIAFQTNILALNAAVEAARAGSAGKGFAVVADEVRNLAQKSAEAAKSTTELIENTVTAVARGTQIADNTAKSLMEVVEKAGKVNEMIFDITAASLEQAQGATQITIGVDQISAVVQTNSATAEQSAAASEELSSQSVLLKQLVSKFKLLDGAYANSYSHMKQDADEYSNYDSDSTDNKY